MPGAGEVAQVSGNRCIAAEKPDLCARRAARPIMSPHKLTRLRVEGLEVRRTFGWMKADLCPAAPGWISPVKRTPLVQGGEGVRDAGAEGSA
jgi:hypothetical protein